MAINFPDSPSVNDTHTVGDRTWKWDGTVWNIVVGTTSDHGNLAGLSDDDHTQYLRTDGTRTAASLTVSGAVAVDTDTFVVDNVNDRVGIGTTSPAAELDVQGNISQGAAGSNAGRLLIDNTTDTVQRVKVSRGGATGQLAFHTGSDTEHVRITNTGNVGINDTTPSYKLDVNGDINTTGALRTDGNKTGMVLTGSGTFASATSFTTQDVFTSDFRNYKVFLYIGCSGNDGCYLRLFQNGTTSFSGTHDRTRIYGQGTVGVTRTASSSYFNVGYLGTYESAYEITIYDPSTSGSRPVIHSFGIYSDSTNRGFLELNACWLSTTASYDGFRIGSVSGSKNIAGYYFVYGMPS